MKTEGKVILNEIELEMVNGGSSEIYDENCTDFWRCGRWMSYLDNYNDDKCKCDSFSSNDPICLGCSHAAASQK